MRFSFAPLMLLGLVPVLLAADPIEKQLSAQKAMVAARQYLQQNQPGDAVAALEGQLANADGNKAYLNLLREAYQSELAVLQKDPAANASRIGQVRRNLDLLGGPAASSVPSSPAAIPSPASLAPSPVAATPTVPAPVLTAGPESVAPGGSRASDAAVAFKTGDYTRASRLFAALGAGQLSADQKAAWAYCRIRLAADKVNDPACDASTASTVEKDVQDALALIPQHGDLRKIGQQVMAAAALKGVGREGPAASPIAAPDWPASSDVMETASFRVRHSGSKETAEAVAKAAERMRTEIFERWSGPPAGGWDPKCEIVIHPTAEAFARATNRPAGGTGTAFVRLTNGRAAERRIELRADNAGMATTALPRELTHIVLADLFPDKPPPKWAEEGMAVLAGSKEEAARYASTLPRCARTGEWFALGQLLEMKDFPAEKITAFYCESVTLTEFLVHLRGERGFTIFLRDCDRYGTPQALRRQYGLDGPQALEMAWKRVVLEAK